MIFEKDQSSSMNTKDENQELMPDSKATVNTDSISTSNNTNESYDSILYDNMIFPS